MTNDLKIPMYKIKEYVLYDIRRSLCLPEMGGILGINTDNIITKFYFDSSGVTHTHKYIPDVDKLNEVIYEWLLTDVRFIGFVHSHPCNKTTLSLVDIKYAKKIKSNCNMSEILMLLYIPETDAFYHYVI